MATNNQSLVRFQSPSTLPPAKGYSQIGEVLGGRIVLIAGQVSADASGTLIGTGDFRAQAAQVFENLKVALEAAGSNFEQVVKMNTYCVESVPVTEVAAFREIRDRYVNTAAPPASTFVFVSRLVRPEWLIEIEAMAVIA